MNAVNHIEQIVTQIVNDSQNIEEHIEQDTKTRIRELNDENFVYKKKIKSNRNKILNLKRKLYQECHHQFIRDYSAASDDVYKYYCSQCSLYRGEF